MLHNVIQLRNEKSLIKNPLRYFLKSLLSILNNVRINKPLYSFTLPGFVLGTSGLYMSLNSMQTFHLGGSFNLENVVLMTLLTILGIIMAFMGVLIHSIAGLIKYKANEF